MYAVASLASHIFITSIIPILLLISVGYILDKFFSLDLFTLSKLNFFILMPSYIFLYLYTSKFTWANLEIVLCAVAVLTLSSISAGFIGKLLHFDKGKIEIFRNSIMFNNGGNMGVAIITFVYTNSPFLVQGKAIYLQEAILTIISLVVIQNLTCNTLGFYQAGQGKYTARDCLAYIFKMPTVYVIPAVFIFRYFDVNIQPTPFWAPLNYISHAFVPMAMLTLGVQINRTPLNFIKKDVLIATCMRLGGGPLFAIATIFLFNRYYAPLPAIAAQCIVIAYSVPSAINTALMALEMDNHPQYATQIVMATTILSTLTMPIAILVAYFLYPL